MQSGAEQGKHGLITGGSAGLGLAIARAAVAQGMGVTLVGRNAERLQKAVEELRKIAPEATVAYEAADLSLPGEPTRVVRKADAERPLDFVCHAAGLSTRGRLVDTPRAEHERLMAINFFAAAELAHALNESFAERRGRLVLVGSLATRVAPANLGAYPTSKHPLAALAQQLRMELGPQGLRTLLVLPGPIARDDAGTRYDDQAANLPDSARRPGGGAKVRALDPDALSEQILAASRAGKVELVRPLKTRLLFTLSQFSPSLGDWLLRKNMRE